MAIFKTRDGVDIFFEDIGTGRPLVLLHGWSASGRAFCKNVPVLSQRYRVINVDLRFHGNSGKPEYGCRIERLSMDVAELLEHLNLENVTMLGWSMGCSVIWGYWELFRNHRLSKMILYDEAPLNLIQKDNQFGFLGFDQVQSLCDYICENHDKALAEFNVQGFTKPQYKEKYLQQFVQESLKMPAKQGTLLIKHHIYADWRDLIPTISIPTLIMAGLVGGVVKPEANRWNYDHIRGAEWISFNCGHFAFLEDADKFNKAVIDFIG